MLQASINQSDFSYDLATDAAGLPARLAVFADRERVRREIAEDCAGAGFRTLDGGAISVLLDGPITLLGDVVMVDCPQIDGAILAALARLDMRAARADAKLIVSTSLEALDDVFAAMDQSDAQILVDPSRADRILAVGQVLMEIGGAKVREMSEEDRLTLLRLSQQVEAIALQLEKFSDAQKSVRDKDSKLSDVSRNWHGAKAEPIGRLSAAKGSLPDPRRVRRMIAERQSRAKFFDAELFADPAWDMLLDLTAAHAENQQVCVTSLCIAAGVPATTALRWVKQLVSQGVFERVADAADKRRAFIALSDSSLQAMTGYFAAIDTPLARAA